MAQVKLTDAELTHLNRVRTLFAERQKQADEMRAVLSGLVEMLAAAHGLAGRPWSFNSDGNGFDLAAAGDAHNGAGSAP